MDEATKTALRVCTFKGSQNIALYIAQQQGFFAAQSLDVTIEYTTGSASQLAGLVRGDYHLVSRWHLITLSTLTTIPLRLGLTQLLRSHSRIWQRGKIGGDRATTSHRCACCL